MVTMTATNQQYYTSYPVSTGLSVGHHLTNVNGETTTPTTYHNQYQYSHNQQQQINHHQTPATYHNLNSHHHLPAQHHYNNQFNHHHHQQQQHQNQNQFNQTTHGQTATLPIEYQLTVNSNQQEQQLAQTITPNSINSTSIDSTSPTETTQTTNLYTTIEVTKSTKGASKLRRDLITKELIQLKQLLPLPTSIRDKLSQLNLMALVLVYVRKSNYFNFGKYLGCFLKNVASFLSNLYQR